MTIQALQNLVPQSIQTEYKSFVTNDHVQKTLLVASDAMKKCIQATSHLLPKEITKDISVDSVVEKIKTCVCNISGAQYCLLFGLTWVSRQIPLVRRISFVFEAAMLVSVLHLFKRMDENNAKSAEENRKFYEDSEKDQLLVLQNKQTIASLTQSVQELNNQMLIQQKINQEAQDLHDRFNFLQQQIQQIHHDLGEDPNYFVEDEQAENIVSDIQHLITDYQNSAVTDKQEIIASLEEASQVFQQMIDPSDELPLNLEDARRKE